ncbi:hypothetical protein LTR78_000604 [Recurvomyces mirabilis]|uniref:Uncharacterized protein n=1 Tax=Recurvomyces mirabilis TaxID=574656 RepID=A0AAE1C6P7_9PEZI|nr:hypothetical protein LTR78_000604 [Recurvomyces mirabilis]KAK5162258.1 hypothetical protein LTS14_000605 [Recurvomyces mirabilis]
MQLDNQLALAFGLITTILTIVGLLTKSATIYQAIDLERQNSSVTMDDATWSNIDHCSAEANVGGHSRHSSTSAVSTAPSERDIRHAASSIDQVDRTNASTTEPRRKPTTTPPKHVSTLTEAKLATHNATTSGTIDHPNHVESCLDQQIKLNQRHDIPDPQAWKELCQEDDRAAEIEAMVKACRHEE